MTLKKPNLFKFLKFYFFIKRSRLFNPSYYLQNYSHELISDVNPLSHFIKTGWQLGYNPSPDFDTQYYLKHNPDVKASGLNPLVHYITQGRKEGRSPKFSPLIRYPRYEAWIREYAHLSNEDIKQIHAKIKAFTLQPNILIILILHEPDEEQIQASLLTLKTQIYEYWEAAILCPNTAPQERFLMLRHLTKDDPRLKPVCIPAESYVFEYINQVIRESSAQFICLLDENDRLAPHALYLCAHEINNHPDAQIIYADEDNINENGDRCDPYFKPEWNPDLFASQDYLNRACFYKKETVLAVGGFHPIKNDNFTRDLTLRVIEGFPEVTIHHLPFVLFHRLKPPQDNEILEINSRQNNDMDILTAHFNRINSNIQVHSSNRGTLQIKYPLPDPKPLVSIIIPTRNAFPLLSTCINSILTKTSYDNFELLVVNNQSNQPETLQYFNLLRDKHAARIIDYEESFNYAAINNLAAQHANGKVLLFLNNDIEVISPDWMEEMVSHAIRPEIGAVGAMLYYPNDTIQHAGIILGLKGVAGHAYQHQPRGFLGQQGRALCVQYFCAVTGACMAVEKQKFEQVGGFDEEHLAIAYNDVDLCLKLLQAGFRNVWTPFAELYHHESASRAYEDDPHKKARLQAECNYMDAKWGKVLMNDPAYNPNLSLVHADFSLAFPPRVNKPWQG